MSTIVSYSPAYGFKTAAEPKRSLFMRLVDRMIEGRMRKAEAFIRQNQHLIPRELENQANWQIGERSEDSLPFIR